VPHLTSSRRTCLQSSGISPRRTRFVRARKAAITLAVAGSLFAIPSPFVAAQDSVPSEYRSKASFLATFPSFVDWPDGAFVSPNAPFIVCVLGDFRFGTTLAEVSRDSLPHGRRLSVRWVRNDQQLRGCHILFVSSSELPRYAKVIALVQGAGTFTVGETPTFSLPAECSLSRSNTKSSSSK
jgi:hypothetical protein